MPQMAPYNWFMLNLFFMFIFLIYMSMLYFFPLIMKKKTNFILKLKLKNKFKLLW